MFSLLIPISKLFMRWRGSPAPTTTKRENHSGIRVYPVHSRLSFRLSKFFDLRATFS